MIRPLLFAALLIAVAPAFAVDYSQAAGSSLTFATRYQGQLFTGRFPSFTTRLSFDPKNLAAAKLDVLIPLANVTTADSERDSNLRGGDFFNTAKFPQARFTSTKFRALGGQRYAADGSLTLHGVSKPVTLAFTWKPGARPVLSGSATVQRLDFGVGGGDWADTGLIPNAVSVSTKVVLQPVR